MIKDVKRCKKIVIVQIINKIVKVKAVSPSPFYDGKYHPPLFRQLTLPLYQKIYFKVYSFFCYLINHKRNLCTFLKKITYAGLPFWLITDLQSPDTFHQVHNNLQDIQQHIEVLHENPGILYIYLE